MELVYSIDFNSRSSVTDITTDDKICCSLSCKNILAFSKAKKSEKPGEKLNTSYEVCVVDLDKPWLKYEVTTYTSPIDFMRWDPAGSRLLLVTSQGHFGLWQMKDFLLNVWEERGSADLEKEEVLVLAWLHNGIQVLFNPEARDSVAYNEKFVWSKISPSVTHFGKKPVDGWIAVTSTGMIHAGLIPEPNAPLVTCRASLGHISTHITQADIAFMQDGKILVATSDGHITSSIHCYSVTLSLSHSVCTIDCTPSASFFLKKQTQPETNQEHHIPRLTRLSFLSRDTSDVLLACWGTPYFSCMEVWHLMEQTIPLNRIFQNASVTEHAYKTKRWVHKSSFSHRAGLADIARPKLPISRQFNMESSNFQCYFACTFKDGTIKIVHRQSYQVLYTSSMEQLVHLKPLVSQDSLEPPEKRSRTSSLHLVSAVQTNTGCGIVGLGEGRMYLFRVFNSRDAPLQMMPAYVILLLEYTLFVGLDVWDVLLAVRQGMIEGLGDLLTANFQKQTGVFQDVLLQRMLRLKMALYSCLGPGNQRAADHRALLTLQSINTLIRSGLRPKAVTAQDKSVSDKLTALCANSTEMDIDQVLNKTLEFDQSLSEPVKSGSGSIQFLQPHTQWIANLSLHLLASVSNAGSYPGVTLMRDAQTLCTIRELLIVIRTWSKITSESQPTFVKTAHIDPFQLIYRLITRAWIAARDNSIAESDKSFIEECYSLPTKIILPGFKRTFGEDMQCCVAFSQPFPINYQFGQEPDFLFNPRHSHRFFPVELNPDVQQQYDCVRQLQLGVKPTEPIRECVRCRSVSLKRKASLAKSAMLKAWELRFEKGCLCGGHWKLQDQVKLVDLKVVKSEH